MRVKDLVEALEQCRELYNEKHDEEMCIFDMTFNEDEFDGDMRIQAVSDVVYEDHFAGSRVGKNPSEDFRVKFQVEDGAIVDRSVEMGKFEDLI